MPYVHDTWPSKPYNVSDEDWVTLKRAALHLKIPKKVVGHSHGSYWIDDIQPYPGVTGNFNRGRMWDAWNPMKNPKQALEILARLKPLVAWLEPHGERGHEVVVDDIFLPFDPDLTNGAMDALCRALVIHAATLYNKDDATDPKENSGEQSRPTSDHDAAAQRHADYGEPGI